MRNRTCLVIVTICGIGAYLAGRHSVVDSTTTVKYKDRIVRQIVRVTDSKGNVKETIHERETKTGRIKKTEAQRKYSVSASYGPSQDDTYGVGVGYRLSKNVSLKADYVRQDGFNAGLIGVQVDF